MHSCEKIVGASHKTTPPNPEKESVYSKLEAAKVTVWPKLTPTQGTK
jgi:hypothetical protein